MSVPAPPDLGRPAGGAPAPAVGEMGWHADPWHRHQVRFFDGEQWTEHVADGGFASLDTEPVAEEGWSHPHAAQETPPGDGTGPRVLADGPAELGLEADLLLLDGRTAEGRRLLATDDREVGVVVTPPRSWAARVAGRLAVSAPDVRTRLVVRAADGTDRLSVVRPARRTAPVVDVLGPSGALGVVEASHVRQGLTAEVRSADGAVVARLRRTGAGEPGPVALEAPSGAVLARLTPVWDVPGGRRHLPPGMLLVDRRVPPGSEDAAAHRDLLLGALLAPELLLPPSTSPT